VRELGIGSVRELLSTPKLTLEKAYGFGRKSMTDVEQKLLGYLSGCPLPAASLTSDRGMFGVKAHTGIARQDSGGRQQSALRLGTKSFINLILSDLPERKRNIIVDRYGLWDGVAETLQDVGDKVGLTRERIRQIEAEALGQLRPKIRRRGLTDFVRAKINTSLLSEGDVKLGLLNKDDALAAMADDCTVDEVLLATRLLRDIGHSVYNLLFEDLIEVEEGVYCAKPSRAAEYTYVRELVREVLEGHKTPVFEQQLAEDVCERSRLGPNKVVPALVLRVLELSASVVRLRSGAVTLAEWPSVAKRDVTALAEAALTASRSPAHFRDVTRKIHTMFPELRKVDERNVHNRLISRPDKFVWVKAGTYGLAAWGLKRPPYLKDRLVELLSQSRYPLPYRYLKEKSLEVCNCRDASVRMTLDMNPKLFKRFDGDQYGLREHYGR
jgi:hypothetical protein